jgi:hypothetical protein
MMCSVSNQSIPHNLFWVAPEVYSSLNIVASIAPYRAIVPTVDNARARKFWWGPPTFLSSSLSSRFLIPFLLLPTAPTRESE